jgi:hypothetical protein
VDENMNRFAIALVLPAALAGCPDIEKPDEPINEREVITTVELTFTPAAGAALVFAHADPENDGAPVIDPIVLPVGAYTLGVRFLNELEDPAEDITEEVQEESDEHQVLVYGSGVESEATGDNAAALAAIGYDDEDANALPVGLAHTVVATTAGTAELQLMLRHLPPENGTAAKSDAVAGDFASGGSVAIGGEVDADVTFPFTVQ